MEEKEFIRQHDTAEANIWYLVDVQWLQEWKQFVTRHGPLPGPIDNSRLVDMTTGHPRPDLRAVDDYRGVNGSIWQFWYQRYSGGPVLARKQLDLYALPLEQAEGGPRVDMSLPGAAPTSPTRSANGSQRRQMSVEAESENTGRTSVAVVGQASGGQSGNAPPPKGRAATVPSPSKLGVLSSFGYRSGHASTGSSTTLARDAEEPDVTVEGKAGKLCCDKCDGPHETDRCPHFKKLREKHDDAWSSYGKSKCSSDSGGDGAPIVRHARVVTQPGDGSCLFHSLSYGLSDGSRAASLRKDICGFIAKNPEMTIADTAIKDWIRWDTNDSVQAYAARMAEGTWGGGIEMAALTRMKKVNVHVYEKCREGYRRISAFEFPGAKKTVNVLYQGRMHYDAIAF